MRIFRRILGAVLAVSAALALLTLITDALAGSPQLMLSLMERHAPPENTGLAAEDYPQAATMIAGYLSGETDTFQLSATVDGVATEAAFNAKEQEHMADVRALFQLDRGVALGAVALSLVCLTACYLLRRPDRQAMRGFRDGLRAVLTALAALLVWGAVDFDSLFILFHRLAFTNDLWLLDPATDLLIRLMPTDFFVHYAALIGGSWLGALCLGEAGMELALRRGGADWRSAIRKGDKSDHGE